MRLLGPAITDVTNVVPTLLNTLSSVTNLVGTLLGSTTQALGSLTQAQNGISGLVSQVQSLTSAVGTVNGLLSGLSNGGGSAGASQIYTLVQGLPAQITNLATTITPVITGANSNLSLTQLQSAVQSLLNACLIMAPGLSNQCPTQALSQLTTTAWATANQALNTCLLHF